MITAPARLHAIEYTGLPSARTKWAPPDVRIRNGNPMAVIRTYSFAYPNTLSGEPKKISIGSRNNSVTRHKITPPATIKDAALPI